MPRGRQKTTSTRTTTTRPEPAEVPAPAGEETVPVPKPDDLLRLKRADGSTYATIGLHRDVRGAEWVCLLAPGLEGTYGIGISLKRREFSVVQRLFDNRIRTVERLGR